MRYFIKFALPNEVHTIKTTIITKTLLYNKQNFNKRRTKDEETSLTWERAHSRTVSILSWSGWKHIPTLPIGCGSVTDVGKLPSQSNLPNRPFHWLCLFAVFGKHQGIKSTICPLVNLTCQKQTNHEYKLTTQLLQYCSIQIQKKKLYIQHSSKTHEIKLRTRNWSTEHSFCPRIALDEVNYNQHAMRGSFIMRPLMANTFI